jgi:hypothetical protein
MASQLFDEICRFHLRTMSSVNHVLSPTTPELVQLASLWRIDVKKGDNGRSDNLKFTGLKIRLPLESIPVLVYNAIGNIGFLAYSYGELWRKQAIACERRGAISVRLSPIDLQWS